MSHAFSLVLYYLAGVLSADDLCIFEYLILPGVAKKKYG